MTRVEASSAIRFLKRALQYDPSARDLATYARRLDQGHRCRHLSFIPRRCEQAWCVNEGAGESDQTVDDRPRLQKHLLVGVEATNS